MTAHPRGPTQAGWHSALGAVVASLVGLHDDRFLHGRGGCAALVYGTGCASLRMAQ